MALVACPFFVAARLEVGSSMATTSTLRLRRTSAQLHALAQVEREIRATDPNSRRKYLRDFAQAFCTYESILTGEQLHQELRQADIVLIGDYHALPASQRYAATLLTWLAKYSGALVLGVESILSRDQHILEEWQQGEIDQHELRQRVRFDLDWGYPWEPFCELLEAARSKSVPIYGLDCIPRNDLRRIGGRDRHAAEKISELRRRYADRKIIVLFGESHLAPNHLPDLLRRNLPNQRILTLLQNVDPLYWRAAGEPREHVNAVQVSQDVVCVFTSTPLEKYESYRLCLDHWTQERSAAPDFGPTVYNLIDALSRFLNINPCSSHNGTQPKFLVDQLPEVCCRPEPQLSKLLERKIHDQADRQAFLSRLEEYGAAYVPSMNSIIVRDFHMMHVAEEASLFLHRACRGAVRSNGNSHNGNGHNGNGHNGNGHSGNNHTALSKEDKFYARALEYALGYFGSRLLYPARPPVRESELYLLYAQSQEEVEGHTVYSYSEYMKLLDFLLMHREYESRTERFSAPASLIEETVGSSAAKFEYLTRRLGYMLGSELYDAYINGVVSKRFLRSLFFRKLDRPQVAQESYMAAARRIHSRHQPARLRQWIFDAGTRAVSSKKAKPSSAK